MKLSPSELARLRSFIGYGRLDAPIWFLGMEEGTGGNETAIEGNLRVRLRWTERVMDMADAHDQHNLNWPYFDPDRRLKVPTVWLFMARIARALGQEQAADWHSDREAARAYVRERLGRRDGETLLAELLPLPRPRASFWAAVYQDVFATAREYEQAVLPGRIDLLAGLVKAHTPRILICYGKRNYEHYRRIAGLVDWKSLPGTRIEVAHQGRTTVALTPFFGNGQLSLKNLDVLITSLRSGAG